MIDKDLLYSTGNYTQYLVITCNGKEPEKTIDATYIRSILHIYIHIHITDSLCCISETNTTLEINCTSIKIFLLKIIKKRKESTTCPAQAGDRRTMKRSSRFPGRLWKMLLEKEHFRQRKQHMQRLKNMNDMAFYKSQFATTRWSTECGEE